MIRDCFISGRIEKVALLSWIIIDGEHFSFIQMLLGIDGGIAIEIIFHLFRCIGLSISTPSSEYLAFIICHFLLRILQTWKTFFFCHYHVVGCPLVRLRFINVLIDVLNVLLCQC